MKARKSLLMLFVGVFCSVFISVFAVFALFNHSLTITANINYEPEVKSVVKFASNTEYFNFGTDGTNSFGSSNTYKIYNSKYYIGDAEQSSVTADTFIKECSFVFFDNVNQSKIINTSLTLDSSIVFNNELDFISFYIYVENYNTDKGLKVESASITGKSTSLNFITNANSKTVELGAKLAINNATSVNSVITPTSGMIVLTLNNNDLGENGGNITINLSLCACNYSQIS